MRTQPEEKTVILRGFATISFWADDLKAAKKWYTDLLGIEPYFERPGYCEFRLGDHQDELGLPWTLRVT
jgi:catechol 2,3-dioxygenase-like lactoylglutathione lyase family enzyme